MSHALLALLVTGCVGPSKETDPTDPAPSDCADEACSDSETDTEASDSEPQSTSETDSEEPTESKTETETDSGCTDCETDTECEDTVTYYFDRDGDGWGDPDNTSEWCDGDKVPPYWVDNSLDCADRDSAEPVWVDDDAKPGGTGGYTAPLQTIQEGIDQANDCVYVLDGDYNEDIDFSGKELVVWGVDGPDHTTLTGTGETAVVTIASYEGPDTLLSGFTITGGYGAFDYSSTVWTCDSTRTCEEAYYRWYGGGIYIESAEPTLTDLVVVNNMLVEESIEDIDAWTTHYTYSYGGGIAVLNGFAYLENVDLQDNYAATGGGLYINIGGQVGAVWSQTQDNSAAVGSAYYVVGELVLENSILCGNNTTSEASAALDVAGGIVALSYVNIVGNPHTNTQLSVWDGGDATLLGSIIHDNTDGDEVYTEAGSMVTASYSDVYPDAWSGYLSSPAGSDGNVSVDPSFTSWSGDCETADLTLSAKSPLLDAGDPKELDADGTTADIGAYGGPYGDW